MSVTKDNLDHRLMRLQSSTANLREYLFRGNYEVLQVSIIEACWNQIHYEFEEARKLATDLIKEIS